MRHIYKLLMDKLEYIAKSNDRTKNKQLEHLVKNCIIEFETENGTITQELIQEMRENK